MDPIAGAPWDDGNVARERALRDNGEQLAAHLIRMYAGAQPMTAVSVCTLAFYAWKGGVDHEMVRRLALRPTQGSQGNFQQHLDRVIPKMSPEQFYWIDVPTHGVDGKRRSKQIPVIPIWEAVEREVAATPELKPENLVNNDNAQAWYRQYLPARCDARRINDHSATSYRPCIDH